MYQCNICEQEATVDHINPPKLNCNCEGGKIITSIEGHAYGRSSFNSNELNNNLSEASAMILKNTLFAISANEFFINKKNEIYARDIVIKDSVTGQEFVFNINGYKK